MKKWIVGFGVLLLLLVGAEFYFIPSRLHVAASGYAGCNARPAAILLLDTAQWQRWWPAHQQNVRAYELNGYQFSISGKSPYAADIIIRKAAGIEVKSVASIILYKNDTTGIEWQCEIISNANPIKRFQNYLLATDIKKCMDHLLTSFIRYSNEEKHIYGVKIEREKFRDTFMISSQTLLPAYPDYSVVYGQIEKLQSYAASHGATPVNPPMLNIDGADSTGYVLKLAVPISKEIPSNDAFRFRFMIQGNTLKSTVKGGTRSVQNAIDQMRLYIGDFHLSSPAIPFESMVTDRNQEKDSSKWVTNIYYPVM